MTTDLQTAFRFHMRNNRPAFYYAHGYAGRNAWPEKAHGIAREALTRARGDIAKGTTRYPAPIKGHAMRAGFDHDKPGSVYVENPESFGLRLVGRVQADTPRGDIWDTRESSGWFDNPFGDYCRDGDGLIYGLVYQLPARKGESRFVAAYQNGCNPDGALIDFSTIYASRENCSYEGAQGSDAARDAARAADSMAESAAESEREYQTAWRAGSDYAQEGETVDSARAELREILKERRAVKGTMVYPALCRAIRSQVASLLDDIATARAKRSELASGDAESLIFWPGDNRLQAAFCDGAGLDSFPA